MSIIRKPNGKYVVDMLNERNRRIQRTFTKRTEAEAFSAALTRKKYERKLVNNQLLSARYPILTALDEYEITKKNLKPNSIKKYGAVISFIREFIKANNIQYVDEFTPAKAEKFYRILIAERVIDKGNFKKTMKAKPKTVNFYLATIRELFKREILKDHLQKSPIIHIKNLKVEKPKPEYYTKEEVVSFFAQPMKLEYYNAFKGFLLTGMRFEELANLRCNDVDLEQKIIYVRNKEGFTAKTSNSIRQIPMSDELFSIVDHLVKDRGETDYLFTSPGGNKLRERSMLEVCKRVSKNAGIRSRAFIHKFRHTFATMLVQADVPIETIKELLGHSSINETLIYAHNKTNHRHHQVKILDQLFK